MDQDQITSKIARTTKYAKVDSEKVADAVKDSAELVKLYPIDDAILGYATYLYACHLLFTRELKSQYKSVKAENGEYTKFDGADTDEAWSAFQDLIATQGMSKYGVQFL